MFSNNECYGTVTLAVLLCKVRQQQLSGFMQVSIPMDVFHKPRSFFLENHHCCYIITLLHVHTYMINWLYIN